MVYLGSGIHRLLRSQHPPIRRVVVVWLYHFLSSYALSQYGRVRGECWKTIPEAVRPDVGIKIVQMFPKVGQKLSTAFFT